VSTWRSTHTTALITNHTAKSITAAAASTSAIWISALASLASTYTTTPSVAPLAITRAIICASITDHPRPAPR
jgi:hypothetical protein